MSVKISELPILDSLADNDVIAGVDTSANVTSKIEMATLKNYIDTNTQYTAGTNIDITNNVVSAPFVYDRTQTNALLENIRDDVNTQIEELQSEVDSLSTIFNAFPTESGEGESLTLDDTAEVKFKKFDLKGNTSQDGTPTPTTPIPVNVVSGDNEIVVNGKNLLNYNNTTVENYYYNASGVKTYDSTNEYVNPIIQVIPNTSYTFSSASRRGSSNCRICQFKKDGTFISRTNTDNNLTYNFTTNSECSYVILSIDKSSTKYYTNIQIEKGSSATSYEPYQGNTYNVDLPVENLMDRNYFTTKAESWPAYENQGEAFKLIPFYVGTGTSVTFSSNVPVASSSTIYAVDELGRTQGTTNNINVNTTRTIVGGTNGYVYLGFVTNRNYYNDLLNGTYWVQIEEGSKANSFTSYGTTPIELCKIGDYQDYFYKNSGKWYLHKEIRKIDISNYNNTEPAGAWSGFEPNGNICMLYNNTGIKSTPIRNDVLSNKFTPQFDSMWNGARIGIQTYANNSKLIIGVTIAEVEEYAGTTLNINNYIENFKRYIVSLNPDIYIILANPTTEEITYQPLIDQLNLLEKAMSKDSQTNISQVNNDLGFVIYAEAIKSLQSVLDRVELLES